MSFVLSGLGSSQYGPESEVDVPHLRWGRWGVGSLGFSMMPSTLVLPGDLGPMVDPAILADRRAQMAIEADRAAQARPVDSAAPVTTSSASPVVSTTDYTAQLTKWAPWLGVGIAGLGLIYVLAQETTKRRRKTA